MIRIQVSLDEDEYRLAKKARNQGISIAEFMRQSVRKMLPPVSGEPWMHYAGLVESGNHRSSQSIDEIIYGVKG